MNRRTTIAAGGLLILFGIIELVHNFLPDTFAFFTWPVSIIGIGVVFILAAILSGLGGLAIPAAIVGGIGGILYYQNMSGDFGSWSYMWALIPGFVGLGVILSGLIEGRLRSSLFGGLILMAISLAMFFIFGGTFGMSEEFVKYWPLTLIALGVIIMLSQILKRKQ